MPKTKAKQPFPNAAKLSRAQQVFVVTSLAVWTPEAEILKQINEEMAAAGRKPISQQALYHYRPGNPECPEFWRALHAKTRSSFLDNVAEIAIANPAWRLAERKRLYDLTISKTTPNLVFAVEQLNDAARDSGGLFSNRRDVTSAGEKLEPGGGTVVVNPVVSAMDLDAAGEAQLREVLRRALDRSEPAEVTKARSGKGRRSPSKF